MNVPVFFVVTSRDLQRSGATPHALPPQGVLTEFSERAIQVVHSLTETGFLSFKRQRHKPQYLSLAESPQAGASLNRFCVGARDAEPITAVGTSHPVTVEAWGELHNAIRAARAKPLLTRRRHVTSLQSRPDPLPVPQPPSVPENRLSGAGGRHPVRLAFGPAVEVPVGG